MKLDFDITLDDYKNYAKFIQSANLKTSPKTIFFALAIGMAFGLSMYFAAKHYYLWYYAPSFFAGMIIIYLLVAFISARMRRKFLPQKDGLILGPRTLTVNDDGIDLVKEHYKSSTKWQGVRNVAETNVHFFIMLDNLTGHIVPKRAFPDEASLQEFSSLINSKSVPRHEYSYDKQMRKVLWSRRFIRLALIFLIVFYVYEHYYAYRPCDSEYSSMYWEPVSKYTGNTESQAVIFTCVNNPEIGFIGYTNEDLLDMLNGSEDGSIVLKLDNNTADTTVPVVSYHTVEFYELDTLDFSSENRFVSCPE